MQTAYAAICIVLFSTTIKNDQHPPLITKNKCTLCRELKISAHIFVTRISAKHAVTYDLYLGQVTCMCDLDLLGEELL